MENEQTNKTISPAALDITMIIDDMWRGFKRYLYLIILVISLAASVFYVKADISYKPVYEAYSTFVVNTRNAVGYSENYYNKATAEQMSKTFPYIVTSGVLKQVVAEDLGMESISSDISAEAMEETALFTIKVKDADPKLAYAVLQSVIKNYPIVSEYIIGDTQLVLMDTSDVPTDPVNPPEFKQTAFKGMLIAAVFCLALLFLYAMNKKTVRRAEDLKERLSIPYLGSVPMIRVKKRGKTSFQPVLMDKKSYARALGETFRTIRTRILKELKGIDTNKILITSAAECEGKSTVTANLGISLAKKGKRVIIIDCDMRNPSMYEVLGIEAPQNGLQEVLDAKLGLEEALTSYGEDLSMSVLGAVTAIKNPTKYLSGDALDMLLEKCSHMADYVLVDAPPCTLVSDAVLLSRIVGATIYVIRQDYVGIKRVVSGIESLNETDTKLIGYIINGTEIGITGYGHGYGYGHSYGYGYGKYGYGRYGYGRYGYGKYGYSYYGQDDSKE